MNTKSMELYIKLENTKNYGMEDLKNKIIRPVDPVDKASYLEESTSEGKCLYCNLANIKYSDAEAIACNLADELDEAEYLLMVTDDQDENDINVYGVLGEPRITVTFDLFN